MTKSAQSNNRFHLIIAGAGCAGLSLLVRLLQQPATQQQRILLVDKEMGSMLNKTWCFWEKEAGFFESIVHQQYDQLWYHGNGYSQLSNIHPFRYKMVRGEDFYNYCMKIISAYPNVEIMQGDITAMSGEGDEARIMVNGTAYHADYIFNSILFTRPQLKPHHQYLLQHFRGWFIETEQSVFDPAAATLMDFRVSQEHGASFVYVMPFSANRALIEYTVFSEKTLTAAQYDAGIRRYIDEQIGTACTITATEEGVIPMTNYRFPESTGRIIHIGTAGGQTKPSSGYTFQFIQQQSEKLVSQLVKREKPVPYSFQRTRFHFYDSVLLQVLADKRLPGEAIFTKLFSRNHLARVLQFLGNQSTPGQEIRLISVLPKLPFLKAALRQLFR